MFASGLIIEGYLTWINGDSKWKDYAMYGNIYGIAASLRFGKIEKDNKQRTYTEAGNTSEKRAKTGLFGRIFNSFKKSPGRTGISDYTENEESAYQELRKQNRRIKPYKNAGENWYGNGWYAPTVNYGNTWFGN